MRLFRLCDRASNPNSRDALAQSLRWMASVMILAGVFTLAPTDPPRWGVQAVFSLNLRESAAESTAFRGWGTQTLEQIESGFRLPNGDQYVEERILANSRTEGAAFLWSRSVHFSALIAAARVDPTYVSRVREYANSLRAYWVESNGLGGFDVLPGPKPVDRYYDDNAWMVLALLDAHEVTRDPALLDWARDTFRFVISGLDEQQGGGIYWREQVKTSKNTCSTAPAALAALRFYQLLHEPGYLQTARELYDWTNARFQDSDGLFFDNVALDGRVDRAKWSYNSALMLEVNLLLRDVTGDSSFLDQAQRIARSAEDRWVDAKTGAIGDDAAFAQHLADAFLMLYRETGDTYWRERVKRALTFLHERAMDSSGRYGRQWTLPLEPSESFRLIDSASAARAYWLLARDP